MSRKAFAHLLSKHIEAAGLKQTYVASTASISYNYLQRLLAGDRNPSEQVVQKLAETLHLTAEQTGELFTSAGYAPPVTLLHSASIPTQTTGSLQIAVSEPDQVSRLIQQLYRLSQDIPETLQASFLEEMNHLLSYARYKYILSKGENLLELEHRFFQAQVESIGKNIEQDSVFSLDALAQLVGELYSSFTEKAKSIEEETSSSSTQAVEDILSSIDQLTGNILSGEVPASQYQPQMIVQMIDLLRQGAPWEIRRRIAEALPGLCKLDIAGTEHLMEALRLDVDKARGVDIRRRVIEALPSLVETSPQSLPVIISFLRPKTDDDKYVALATIETCDDIQTQITHMLENNSSPVTRLELPDVEFRVVFKRGLTELATIQRQLLMLWEGKERESLQFSLALHHLLCAPDTLLLSLREGLQSSDLLLQWVAARYLERLLPLRPVDTLELYQNLLYEPMHRNIRRTVAKALPALLQCLKEESLPVRVLARTIMSDLAIDTDIYIRRAVADHAMQLFLTDREFLLILLRKMYKDTDGAIRHRLRPVALCLAQVWLTWYAETAGLVDTKRRSQTTVPFGE